MTDGLQIRDFSAVSDIASAVLAAIDREPEALIETFNLGTGQAWTVRELVERVVAELCLATDLRFGMRKPQPYEPAHLVADATLAHELLHWQPQTNISHAVWQLANEMAPELNLEEPDPAPWMMPQQ